ASERTAALADAGARVVLAADPAGQAAAVDTAAVDEVVVSPGFAPHHPLAAAAVAAGLDVYSEPELAWRLRGPDAPPWLAVTGTRTPTAAPRRRGARAGARGWRPAARGTPRAGGPGARGPAGAGRGRGGRRRAGPPRGPRGGGPRRPAPPCGRQPGRVRQHP